MTPVPPRPATRLVGVDVARCVALVAMMATHVLASRDPDGTIATAQWVAGGRASALFAVLAGVSLALMTGAREPVRGRERAARSAGLAVRALLIALLGLVLGDLESGLAVILTYYGVLFVLALPFLGLRTPALLVLAVVWIVLAPVVSHLVRPAMPPRGVSSPSLAQLGDLGQLAGELVLTGYYPALPWLAYVLVGLAIGRADLGARRTYVVLVVGGLVTAVASTLVSRALTARAGIGAALTSDPATGESVGQLMDRIAFGVFGTTPTGGAWEWLLVVAPHSATPFDLAQTAGSSALVLGACLLVVTPLRGVPARAAQVFAGAGAMTLTLYSLHVVMKSPWVWPAETPDTYRWHVLVTLAVGALFAAARRRGPIEAGVRVAADALAAAVRGAPGTGRARRTSDPA